MVHVPVDLLDCSRVVGVASIVEVGVALPVSPRRCWVRRQRQERSASDSGEVDSQHEAGALEATWRPGRPRYILNMAHSHANDRKGDYDNRKWLKHTLWAR